MGFGNVYKITCKHSSFVSCSEELINTAEFFIPLTPTDSALTVAPNNAVWRPAHKWASSKKAIIYTYFLALPALFLLLLVSIPYPISYRLHQTPTIVAAKSLFVVHFANADVPQTFQVLQSICLFRSIQHYDLIFLDAFFSFFFFLKVWMRMQERSSDEITNGRGSVA